MAWGDPPPGRMAGVPPGTCSHDLVSHPCGRPAWPRQPRVRGHGRCGPRPRWSACAPGRRRPGSLPSRAAAGRGSEGRSASSGGPDSVPSSIDADLVGSELGSRTDDVDSLGVVRERFERHPSANPRNTPAATPTRLTTNTARAAAMSPKATHPSGVLGLESPNSMTTRTTMIPTATHSARSDHTGRRYPRHNSSVFVRRGLIGSTVAAARDPDPAPAACRIPFPARLTTVSVAGRAGRWGRGFPARLTTVSVAGCAGNGLAPSVVSRANRCGRS